MIYKYKKEYNATLSIQQPLTHSTAPKMFHSELTDYLHKIFGLEFIFFAAKGNCQSFYYKDFREAARQTVNEWIRTSGHYDAVIDLDKTVRNPADISTLLPEAQSGDYLHPNELGYKIFGESVDLSLFK